MNTTFTRSLLALPLAACLIGATMFLMAGCAGEADPDNLASVDAALWCNEHGVEEKYCVLCHPEILEGDLLLCPEHGNIPEEICTACHPELKEKYRSCPHDLPTSFCPDCSPEFAEFQKKHGTAGGEHAHGKHHDHDHDHHDDHKGESS